MKKISFIILCFLMLFLGFNVYASPNNEIEYEEYTGQAVSDDYKTEDDDVSTYGAITVDPGLGGNSDDEFEMNDSFQTATDITKLISYNGYVGNFTKYLSIVNHSNGNVDKDFFYFDNQYLCKTFSISITTDSFVEYNLQLYSVQGNEYVLVKSSDLGIGFTNFECGSYVLRLVFTNNTQAAYKISINSEKTDYRADYYEISATSIYDGLAKKINVQTSNFYFKFYPNKSGQFTLDYDLNYIKSVEIYEYVTYNNFVSGTRKKIYNLENDKTEVNLFQANMSANRKLNPDSTTGYYVHIIAKKRGETSFKIKYKEMLFYDYTKLTKTKPQNILYPMDDLSVFTIINAKSNVESSLNETILFNELTEDFQSGDSHYDNVFGGTNIESNYANKNVFGSKDNFSNHISIYRYAVISYLEDYDTGEIYAADVEYARVGIIENITGSTVNIYTVLLMNYKYTYIYDDNILSLNGDCSTIYLTDFDLYAFSNNGKSLYDCNFEINGNIDIDQKRSVAISNVEKKVAEGICDAICERFKINSWINAIEFAKDIVYLIEDDYTKDTNEEKLKQLQRTIYDLTDENTFSGINTSINYKYSDNNMNGAKVWVSPYYPVVNELARSNSNYYVKASVSENTGLSIYDNAYSYKYTFCFKYLSIYGIENEVEICLSR